MCVLLRWRCPVLDWSTKRVRTASVGELGESIRVWGREECSSLANFHPWLTAFVRLPGEAAHQLIVPPEQTILDYFSIVQDIHNYSTFLTHILPQVGAVAAACGGCYYWTNYKLTGVILSYVLYVVIVRIYVWSWPNNVIMILWRLLLYQNCVIRRSVVSFCFYGHEK